MDLLFIQKFGCHNALMMYQTIADIFYH